MLEISRRRLLMGGAALPAAQMRAQAEPMLRVPEGTARDRMWLFTVGAGLNDGYLERGGIRGGSRMTPAEGAYYLGVPNVILVREHNVPASPSRETPWKAKTSFEQYAISFRPLKRVVWSIVGSGGQMQGNEAPLVLNLAKSNPNIMGAYFDDFLRPEGQRLKGALTPNELRARRASLTVGGRRLETWLTLYTREVSPSSPGYRPSDVPLTNYLDPFDIVLLWTWNSDELNQLEENFANLVKIRPKGNGLGLYLWDFHNSKPVPIPLMEKQCKLGLQWLKEGKIREMVFLANTVLDVGLEVVEWTRNWIESVASERV
jgi:hypothetical protein